jgi:elongator complex protein 3
LYFTGNSHFLEVLEGAALIREVHVFGDQLPFGALPDGSGQHMGFGKKMIAEATQIVSEKYKNIHKMAVIS